MSVMSNFLNPKQPGYRVQRAEAIWIVEVYMAVSTGGVLVFNAHGHFSRRFLGARRTRD